tara:strand:+ start:157 stop:444 length:288 start_codon:yes stop_codon:yes gene_type:complete
MSRFKYKIVEIDYSVCEIAIRYWTDGMTSYDANVQSIRFYPDEIKDLTLEEFDRFIYKNVEVDFKNLVKRLQEYKDGKFDVLEKASNTVRVVDVL